MTYSILKARAIKGHDGQGYEATLGRDGKAIATVFDDGWGGALQFTWADARAARVEVTVTGWDDKPVTLRCTPEEAALHRHVETLPQIDVSKMYGDGKPHFMRETTDTFVGGMVEEKLEERRLVAMLKRGTVVLVDKAVYTVEGVHPELPATVARQLAAKHPGADQVVLNALPIADAVKRYLDATR